jgi:hypothetical protein
MKSSMDKEDTNIKMVEFTMEAGKKGNNMGKLY